MSVPADADPENAHAAGLRAAAGLVAGFAVLALVNAGGIAARVPMPAGGVGLRVAHHLVDAAETLGLGVLAGALAGGFTTFVRLPTWAITLVYTAATAPILYQGLGDQLYREACVPFEGRFTNLLFAVFVLGSSFAVSVAHLAGAYFSRFRWLRLIPFVLATAGMIVDHVKLPDDYLGSHCALAWVCATLAGASIAPLAERLVLAASARRNGRFALAAALAFAAFGLLFPPGNALRVQLFRQPVAVGPWVLAYTLWRAPHPRSPEPPPASPWLRDRAALPPVPPRETKLVPGAPVVVLITIDATRAEAVNDPKNEALFPTFTEMKRRGAWFTQASSPGGQTAVSLTTLFSGKSFSELYWTMSGKGSSRFLYATEDASPRFPELLSQSSVKTSIFCSINFLAGAYGVARGFREERVIPEGRKHALAKQMIEPVLDRLRRAGPEPLFLYTHLMEPHAPYDRGRKDGTDYERYISEIAVADANIGKVLHFLEQRFPSRGVLIVSADHGEAFGEHETREHTKTIYEELLRVPLLVRGAGIRPREIHDRVGLVDLGPTILDLFGVPTPATFGGESLVPLLAGEPGKLTRPLIAEGRLRRALYTPDGLKVITDQRRKVVEVFDLTRDPAELDNLWDRDPARADRALGLLEAWFDAHTIARPRYRPPYKP